jgi:hypothetical protein
MNLKAALLSFLLGSPLTVESDRSHNITADDPELGFHLEGILWEYTDCKQLFPHILFTDAICYQQLSGEAQLCHQNQTPPILRYPNLITFYPDNFKRTCYLPKQERKNDNSCETIPAPVSVACLKTSGPAKSF